MQVVHNYLHQVLQRKKPWKTCIYLTCTYFCNSHFLPRWFVEVSLPYIFWPNWLFLHWRSHFCSVKSGLFPLFQLSFRSVSGKIWVMIWVERRVFRCCFHHSFSFPFIKIPQPLIISYFCNFVKGAEDAPLRWFYYILYFKKLQYIFWNFLISSC